MSRIPLTDRYPGVAALPRVGLVEAPPRSTTWVRSSSTRTTSSTACG